MPALVQSVNKHVNGNQVILNVLAACNRFSYKTVVHVTYVSVHYRIFVVYKHTKVPIIRPPARISASTEQDQKLQINLEWPPAEGQ